MAGTVSATTLAYMAGASLAMSAIGTGLSVAGQMQSADAAEASAKRASQVAAVEAGQKRAVAQKQASEERRQGRIASSNLQAAAASSGMSASDIGVIDLEQDIAGEGEYRSMMRLYEGEQAAQNIITQGQSDSMMYKNKASEARWGAGGTALSGMSSIMSSGMDAYDKYKTAKKAEK